MIPRWGFNLSATEVSRNDAHNLRLRFESAILAVMSSAEEPFEPYPQIDCIDCGGRAFLLTHPREEGPRWLPGDIVAYRCEDCLDRWDLVLPEDEEFPDC